MFVACIFLGGGATSTRVACWRSSTTFDEARRNAAFMGKVADLHSPMYSGWVLRADVAAAGGVPQFYAHGDNPSAWRIW